MKNTSSQVSPSKSFQCPASSQSSMGDKFSPKSDVTISQWVPGRKITIGLPSLSIKTFSTIPLKSSMMILYLNYTQFIKEKELVKIWHPAKSRIQNQNSMSMMENCLGHRKPSKSRGLTGNDSKKPTIYCQAKAKLSARLQWATITFKDKTSLEESSAQIYLLSLTEVSRDHWLWRISTRRLRTFTAFWTETIPRIASFSPKSSNIDFCFILSMIFYFQCFIKHSKMLFFEFISKFQTNESIHLNIKKVHFLQMKPSIS